MDLEALGWRRSTSYQRPLVTKLGRVVFTVVKVKRGRRVFSPIIYTLNIEKRKYSRDVRMLLADKASRLSYQDAQTDFMNHTGVKVPKRTIHSFVQEIGRQLGEANQPRGSHRLYASIQPPDRNAYRPDISKNVGRAAPSSCGKLRSGRNPAPGALVLE